MHSAEPAPVVSPSARRAKRWSPRTTSGYRPSSRTGNDMAEGQRARRIWHIEQRFGFAYATNQFGGFTRHANLEEATAEIERNIAAYSDGWDNHRIRPSSTVAADDSPERLYTVSWTISGQDETVAPGVPGLSPLEAANLALLTHGHTDIEITVAVVDEETERRTGFLVDDYARIALRLWDSDEDEPSITDAEALTIARGWASDGFCPWLCKWVNGETVPIENLVADAHELWDNLSANESCWPYEGEAWPSIGAAAALTRHLEQQRDNAAAPQAGEAVVKTIELPTASVGLSTSDDATSVQIDTYDIDTSRRIRIWLNDIAIYDAVPGLGNERQAPNAAELRTRAAWR
ncbi:hypothetical protein AB0C65_35535 [Nocardia sp. NPDC048505]|uniref:hypothetical protein n=1 Tax=Nocardia sp. NPDC048505 TaxID=3155756 RepID=UPI0033E41808